MGNRNGSFSNKSIQGMLSIFERGFVQYRKTEINNSFTRYAISMLSVI